MQKFSVFILTIFLLQPLLSAETNEELSNKLIKDAKRSYKMVVKLNNALAPSVFSTPRAIKRPIFFVEPFVE